MKDSKMKRRYTASNKEETVITDQKKPEELKDDDLDGVTGGISLNYTEIEWTYKRFRPRDARTSNEVMINSLHSMAEGESSGV